MDILVAAENLRLLQARINARLNDPSVDPSLIEKLYVMDGRRYKCLSFQDLKQRYCELIRNMAYLLDDVRDLAPKHCNFVSSWWWIDRYIEFHAEFKQRACQPPPLPPEAGDMGRALSSHQTKTRKRSRLPRTLRGDATPQGDA